MNHLPPHNSVNPFPAWLTSSTRAGGALYAPPACVLQPPDSRCKLLRSQPAAEDAVSPSVAARGHPTPT